MKATIETGITLDRISTREELVEVMDMLCNTRILGRMDGDVFPASPEAPASDDMSMDDAGASKNDDRVAGELSSLTNLLLGEFEWVN